MSAGTSGRPMLWLTLAAARGACQRTGADADPSPDRLVLEIPKSFRNDWIKAGAGVAPAPGAASAFSARKALTSAEDCGHRPRRTLTAPRGRGPGPAQAPKRRERNDFDLAPSPDLAFSRQWQRSAGGTFPSTCSM